MVAVLKEAEMDFISIASIKGLAKQLCLNIIAPAQFTTLKLIVLF